MTISSIALEESVPKRGRRGAAKAGTPPLEQGALPRHLQAYYAIKPYMPRRLQVQLRRTQAGVLRRACAASWPITPSSIALPEGWPGWPMNKQFALVLTHDVEGPSGLTRVEQTMRLEQAYGFHSSFNFVPKRSHPTPRLQTILPRAGFEIGVHGLYHDGKLLQSRGSFCQRATAINRYLKQWKAVGFRAPAMHGNLPWFHDLDLEYDMSTFNHDPFEPLGRGVGTLFPFWVANERGTGGYVELPYTLTQDYTVFVLLQEKSIAVWKRQLDWVAKHGGMVLINTHPDYMDFGGNSKVIDEYPVAHYEALLDYLQQHYADRYWHVLPKELAGYCRRHWSATAPPGAATVPTPTRSLQNGGHLT